MKIRKNISQLNNEAITRLKDALKALSANAKFKALINLYANPASGNSLCYHQVGLLHLIWHRMFLHKVEVLLQEIDADKENPLMIPYWDFTDPATFKKIFNKDFLGAFPPKTSESNNEFSLTKELSPDFFDWSIDVNGWGKQTIKRAFVNRSLPTKEQIDSVLACEYYAEPTPESSDELFNYENSFALRLIDEIASPVFAYVGGTSNSTLLCAVDPVFLLIQSNIDRLWVHWQMRHSISYHYPDYAIAMLKNKVHDHEKKFLLGMDDSFPHWSDLKIKDALLHINLDYNFDTDPAGLMVK